MSSIKEVPFNIEKVDRIHHLADVHIRNFSRHKEYNVVLERVYNRIREKATPNSLITVLGDVAHSKTEMSPELVDLISKFLTELESIRPVLLIPGNHDGNVRNSERLDALTPVVENLQLDNLEYIKTSGLYRVGNVVFSHFSVFDDEKEYVSASKIPSEFVKVALYHGTVDRSVTDYGYVLKNEDMTEMKFVGFDIALLGDIHKRQKVSDYEEEEMVVNEDELEKYLNSGWELVGEVEDVEEESENINSNKNKWFE